MQGEHHAEGEGPEPAGAKRGRPPTKAKSLQGKEALAKFLEQPYTAADMLDGCAKCRACAKICGSWTSVVEHLRQFNFRSSHHFHCSRRVTDCGHRPTRRHCSR